MALRVLCTGWFVVPHLCWGQDLFLQPGQPALAVADHDGWVFTLAVQSQPNICLDVIGDVQSGSLVQIWECNGMQNQLWFFDAGTWMIQSAASPSLCLDSGDMGEGNRLMLWDCNGLSQQRWGYDSDVGTVYLADTMKATDASLCMDLAGVDALWGTPVVLHGCNGQWEQQFILRNGITIRAGQDYTLCLDLQGGATDNGTPIWLWTCTGLPTQQWEFRDGDFAIRYAGDPSKCVDAGGLADGSQLFLWDCNSLDQQIWGYDSSSGTVFLSNSLDASLCMDIPDGSLHSGVVLEVSACSSCWNQNFQVIGPVEGNLLADRQPQLRLADCPPVPPSSDAFLPRCDTGDQHGWPSFDNRADLKASPWGKYFELVYGEIPSTGYPICTFGQTMLYKPHLVTAGLMVDSKLSSPPLTLNGGCPAQAGEWYNSMTSLEADWSSWIWHPNLASPATNSLPSNTWVEGLHKAFGGDGTGTWIYYAPGTSMWVFLGETKAYNDHPDAVQDLLGVQCGDTECGGNFPAMYNAITLHNLNTIQFLKHADMACGNGAIEIVDPIDSGVYPCAQKDSGLTRFKAGWQAQHDCVCDNTAADQVLNCKDFGLNGR